MNSAQYISINRKGIFIESNSIALQCSDGRKKQARERDREKRKNKTFGYVKGRKKERNHMNVTREINKSAFFLSLFKAKQKRHGM